MLTWQENARSTYQPTDTLEESRQHYATVWIQRYQRFRASAVEMEDVTFAQLLRAFRHYGALYDQGYRVRDGEESAA